MSHSHTSTVPGPAVSSMLDRQAGGDWLSNPGTPRTKGTSSSTNVENQNAKCHPSSEQRKTEIRKAGSMKMVSPWSKRQVGESTRISKELLAGPDIQLKTKIC